MSPPPLRVALGGLALIGRLTGIGQYVWHLGHGLQARGDIDLSVFYGTRFRREVDNVALPVVGRFRSQIRNIPGMYTLAWHLRQRQFTRGAREQRFDVYHEPNYLPYEFDGPTVLTVHDLSWIRYPETHPAERVRTMNRQFEPGLRRADFVLTDSEYVRQEVIATFGIDPARIRSVPLGVEPLFHPRSAEAARPVLAPLELEYGRFFLCVGTLEPRKNLRNAVAAYRALPAEVQARYPLVLAGMRGWDSPEFDALLRPLIASGHVRLLGYLPREDLATVTASAVALVYPSVYEGFGLPPLEAMACGVPAVVSTASSLPEVVGDTGLLVEPSDVDALRDAMLRIAQDPALRADLSTRALQRASTFTWQSCAAATAECYRLAREK